ncbi:MAG: hypothetical protein KGH63_01640 [Candidatus Micrarchaeota archaeon]|nr:hypothetical protein [Candidatus Micrarchaeota archaeon]
MIFQSGPVSKPLASAQDEERRAQAQANRLEMAGELRTLIPSKSGSFAALPPWMASVFQMDVDGARDAAEAGRRRNALDFLSSFVQAAGQIVREQTPGFEPGTSPSPAVLDALAVNAISLVWSQFTGDPRMSRLSDVGAQLKADCDTSALLTGFILSCAGVEPSQMGLVLMRGHALLGVGSEYYETTTGGASSDGDVIRFPSRFLDQITLYPKPQVILSFQSGCQAWALTRRMRDRPDRSADEVRADMQELTRVAPGIFKLIQ